jgi:hypothetical protein
MIEVLSKALNIVTSSARPGLSLRAGPVVLSKAVALGAEPVDSIEHSIKQGFSRSRRQSGPFELPDATTLTGSHPQRAKQRFFRLLSSGSGLACRT